MIKTDSPHVTKLTIFALIPLILSIGIVPAIPFVSADSTIRSAKSNTDAAFTAATFVDKYKDVSFTGKRVSVVIKVVGESENSDPSKMAKEIRYLQSYVLKFLSFSNAVNVVSNQQKNEITAQIDTAWIPILEQRKDVVSVTVLEIQKGDKEYLENIHPLKQMANGIAAKDVICKSGLSLMIRNSGTAACVSPTTADKLEFAGWGIIQSESMIKEKDIESDPLLSWNDGNSKQQLIEFVEYVTTPASAGYVPPEDRIATFDNDGTLWIEQPLYIPFGFHLEYLYEQIENESSLISQSPYSEILEKKESISNDDLEEIPNLSDILLTAYPEISQTKYLEKSKEYLDNTKHARFNVALKELTYVPMVELIYYLQANDFQVYIVSAGFQGMMRAVSEELYNVEKDNVIGTHPQFVSELTEQGIIQIRQPVLASFNDGAEKPVNIQKVIGKIPIFACGNSGGDIEMLMLTHFHENHFGCMLNHDDEQREYYYPNAEALEASEQNEWLVISMKDDFKIIFENLE